MGPANSHRISRVPRYSGYHQAALESHIPGFHRLWPLFPKRSISLISCHIVVLQPHNCRNNYGLGYSAFARHYLRNHFCFLLLWVLRCFSSPRSLLMYKVTGLLPAGLPHSEIFGSRVICTFPKLIAAYHVLHRLREPRHPPSALAYFLITDTFLRQVDISLACSCFVTLFCCPIRQRSYFNLLIT